MSGMFGSYGEKTQFKRAHARLLQQQRITETEPGSIVHDFEALLGYVREQPLRVTGTHQLPLRSLQAINERLHRPLTLGFKRPQQKSYPPIQGLYLLLRASGLTYLDHAGSQPHLVVDGELVGRWETLNLAERYGTLLETWLLRAHPEIVGESPQPFYPIPENCDKMVEPLRPARRASLGAARLPAVHARLAQSGSVAALRPPGDRGGPARRRRRLADHRAAAHPLWPGTARPAPHRVLLRLRPASGPQGGGRDPVGHLAAPTAPLLPGVGAHPAPARRAPLRQGRHIFKVRLWKGLWRRLAVPAEATLEQLADAILKVYAFDHDHLYDFRYENRLGIEERLYHPSMDEGPWVSEVQAGALPLRPGQEMTFLYDYGDHWEFQVTLEEIRPSTAEAQIRLLEGEGQPPEQYP